MVGRPYDKKVLVEVSCWNNRCSWILKQTEGNKPDEEDKRRVEVFHGSCEWICL